MWFDFAIVVSFIIFLLLYPVTYSISDYFLQKTRYIAFHNDNLRRKAGYVKKWYGWISPEFQTWKHRL